MLFNLESTEDYISIRNKQNYKMCDFGYDVTTSIFTGLFDSVTVDQEIGKARAMVYKAFDNDIIGGDTIKAFKRIKKLLIPGSDVRDRVLSGNEFDRLLKHATREMFDRYNTIDDSDTRQAVTQMVDFVQSVDHSVDQGTKKAPTDNVENSVRA